MKIKIISLAMLLLSNMTLATPYSDDNIDIDQSITEVEETQNLPQAPSQLIDDLKDECKNYAMDDDLPDHMLGEYVASCVNDELDAQGYQKVYEVAKAEPEPS